MRKLLKLAFFETDEVGEVDWWKELPIRGIRFKVTAVTGISLLSLTRAKSKFKIVKYFQQGNEQAREKSSRDYRLN